MSLVVGIHLGMGLLHITNQNLNLHTKINEGVVN